VASTRSRSPSIRRLPPRLRGSRQTVVDPASAKVPSSSGEGDEIRGREPRRMSETEIVVPIKAAKLFRVRAAGRSKWRVWSTRDEPSRRRSTVAIRASNRRRANGREWKRDGDREIVTHVGNSLRVRRSTTYPKAPESRALRPARGIDRRARRSDLGGRAHRVRLSENAGTGASTFLRIVVARGASSKLPSTAAFWTTPNCSLAWAGHDAASRPIASTDSRSRCASRSFAARPRTLELNREVGWRSHRQLVEQRLALLVGLRRVQPRQFLRPVQSAPADHVSRAVPLCASRQCPRPGDPSQSPCER
jgi:hypothetical protein